MLVMHGFDQIAAVSFLQKVNEQVRHLLQLLF